MLARSAEFCRLQAHFVPMLTECAATKACRIAHSAITPEAAIGLFAGIAYVVVIIAVALLCESRGTQLAVYD